MGKQPELYRYDVEYQTPSLTNYNVPPRSGDVFVKLSDFEALSDDIRGTNALVVKQARDIEASEARVSLLELQNQKLLAALEFYADADNLCYEEKIQGKNVLLAHEALDGIAIAALETYNRELKAAKSE